MSDPRKIIVQTADERGFSLSALSHLVGRNAAYLQQFIYRGSPRVLPEYERRLLAMALDLDETLLGARMPWMPGAVAAARR